MITLTNGVQIPENAVQLRTTAAIDGYYVIQPLQLVQYDETLPVAAVQLTYQSQPYIPPTGAELNVRMNKPDGKGVYNPCLGVDSSGIVYFVFTQQMTVVAGDGKLTIEVTDSGVKNSALITVNVAENPVQEGSIESADEFLTLREILAEAEKWGQIVQANAANIQQVVDNLEDIQNAAENAQAAAASAAAAQQAAQKALGFRTFFSAVTPDANGNLDPSRPMTVGPAASVEIESAGDRIQSVTALGFTQQAGTGDPSPTNVREIINGGLKLVKLVLNGTEGWILNPNSGTAASGSRRFQLGMSVTSSNASASVAAVAYCSHFDGTTPANSYGSNYDNTFSVQNADLQLRVAGISTVGALKQFLVACYDAGDPVIVWYAPADESGATGLYAPIILTSGEYRAACLPLTAPLCEGDSVVSWTENTDDDAESVETHVQSVVVADGSTTALTQGSGGYALALPGAANGAVKCDTFNNLTAASGSVVIPASQFPSSVTSLETANQWLQSNNVTVVYPLAAPAVYTHDPVAPEAATGDQLTYTVTGQSGGTVSVSLKPFQDGGHAKTADNAQQLDGLTLAALQNLLVPVGYIFSWAPTDDGPDLSTPAKVAAYFGFGAWQAYGTGQVLVGVDSGQTEFATVGKTGGEKAHSLTTAEGPKHAHGVKWEHEGGLGTGNGVLIKDANDGESYPYTYFTEFSGSGQPHNNLQPFITVYRWQRVK